MLATLRARLWPTDRLIVGALLYLIWIPFLVMLVLYVDENRDEEATQANQTAQQDGEAADGAAADEAANEEADAAASEAAAEEDDPNDFAATVGWTWAFLWLGYAAAAAWLARLKGRDPIRWGLASLLTFILLFPLLATAPELRRQ